jgi:hypothetical protein
MDKALKSNIYGFDRLSLLEGYFAQQRPSLTKSRLVFGYLLKNTGCPFYSWSCSFSKYGTDFVKAQFNILRI